MLDIEPLRALMCDVCGLVCRENEVDILRGVLSSDTAHMFASAPSKLAISDLVRKMKGRWRLYRSLVSTRNFGASSGSPMVGLGLVNLKWVCAEKREIDLIDFSARATFPGGSCRWPVRRSYLFCETQRSLATLAEAIQSQARLNTDACASWT